MTPQKETQRRRNAVITENQLKVSSTLDSKLNSPHTSPRLTRRNAQIPAPNGAKEKHLHFPVKRKIHRRAATTGNIELIAASQAKQVKIVVMGAESTGKTGVCVCETLIGSVRSFLSLTVAQACESFYFCCAAFIMSRFIGLISLNSFRSSPIKTNQVLAYRRTAKKLG